MGAVGREEHLMFVFPTVGSRGGVNSMLLVSKLQAFLLRSKEEMDTGGSIKNWRHVFKK